MKVMFDPYIGSTLSFRSTNNVAKQASREIPRPEGYSNEEIYNAIMNVKNAIKGVFSRDKSKTINTYA